MQGSLCPIPKILVPMDDTRESRRVVQYAGCLAAPYGEGLRGITLAHVIGSGYLMSHEGYRDLRVMRLEESEAFRRIREIRYGEDILPMLDRAAEILEKEGVEEGKIGRVVLHGKAWKEILAHAVEGEFSTIVMGRSTAEQEDVLDLGSVAQAVIQRAVGTDVYLVGKHVLEQGACPIPRVLVPMDGSAHSLAAFDHAMCMAQSLGGVMDVAVLSVQGSEEGDPERVLDAARAAAAQWALPGDRIRFVKRQGDPGKQIAAEAELGDFTTVIMGRRGHTGLRHLNLGAVALSVIQRTVSPTVALISA